MRKSLLSFLKKMLIGLILNVLVVEAFDEAFDDDEAIVLLVGVHNLKRRKVELEEPASVPERPAPHHLQCNQGALSSQQVSPQLVLANG
jgi:hypothetical protein